MNLRSWNVENIIKNIEKTDFSVPKVEEVLAEIKGAGGVVRYVKDPVSGFVEVLLVQTRDMRELVKQERPRFFQNDTTFGTQREGYKLHVPVYHSNTTDKWEVSCLMFLSTETKEKVEAAVTFFKESLESLYNLNSVGRMIFYCDKDFDYISGKNLYLCESLPLLFSF